MKTPLTAAALLATLLALGSAPAFAKSGASGTVSINGDAWSVADAVATLEGEDLSVVFAQKTFDRGSWAEDGQFDTFDLWHFEDGSHAQSLTIRIGSDNGYSGYGIKARGGGGGGYKSSHAAGVSITARDDKHVAGTIKLDDDDLAAEVAFDLPIQAFGPLARPGAALPEDGGEPGRALMSDVAAKRSGDVDRLIAISPPEQRAQMEATKASGEAKRAMEFLKAMTPQVDRITGGSVDGDRAWVDFDGQQDGAPINGTAEMKRVDGQWYVESMGGISMKAGG